MLYKKKKKRGDIIGSCPHVPVVKNNACAVEIKIKWMIRKHIPSRYVLCVFVRHLFLFYPFYFDFHSARIIFDVSSGFYLWNINKTTA